MNLLGVVLFIIYCAIGIVFNGVMNEEWQEFSIILMLFWPLVAIFLVIGLIFTALITIGQKIKEKWL
jgi:hypothetical protein